MVGELAAAAALLAVFVANEARTTRPLMPLRTFRLLRVAAANGVAILQFSAMIPVFLFLTLYMQQVLRYSLLQAGLAFLPLTVGVFAITGSTARLIQRYGPRPTMIAGPAIFAGGLLYLSRLRVRGTYLPDILPGILIVAAGADAGQVFAAARTDALAAAHADQAHTLTGEFDRAFLVAADFAVAAALLAAITAPTRPAPSVTAVTAPAASAPTASPAPASSKAAA